MFRDQRAACNEALPSLTIKLKSGCAGAAGLGIFIVSVFGPERVEGENRENYEMKGNALTVEYGRGNDESDI